MLGTSGRIHSQSPQAPGLCLLGPVSGAQWVCRAGLLLLALYGVDTRLRPSPAYIHCRALGHGLAEGFRETVCLVLLLTFVPCGFQFSLGLAHGVTEANCLC